MGGYYSPLLIVFLIYFDMEFCQPILDFRKMLANIGDVTSVELLWNIRQIPFPKFIWIEFWFFRSRSFV